jgi:hypothetical protein
VDDRCLPACGANHYLDEEADLGKVCQLLPDGSRGRVEMVGIHTPRCLKQASPVRQGSCNLQVVQNGRRWGVNGSILIKKAVLRLLYEVSFLVLQYFCSVHSFIYL